MSITCPLLVPALVALAALLLGFLLVSWDPHRIRTMMIRITLTTSRNDCTVKIVLITPPRKCDDAPNLTSDCARAALAAKFVSAITFALLSVLGSEKQVSRDPVTRCSLCSMTVLSPSSLTTKPRGRTMVTLFHLSWCATLFLRKNTGSLSTYMRDAPVLS